VKLAAKFYERTPLKEGKVTRAPSTSELDALHAGFPTATITMQVTEGDELSELVDQDAYSSTLIELYMGAASEEKLLEQHSRLIAALPLEVDGEDVTRDFVGNAPVRAGVPRMSTSRLRPPISLDDGRV
jgi:hypothetical protein